MFLVGRNLIVRSKINFTSLIIKINPLGYRTEILDRVIRLPIFTIYIVIFYLFNELNGAFLSFDALSRRRNAIEK